MVKATYTLFCFNLSSDLNVEDDYLNSQQKEGVTHCHAIQRSSCTLVNTVTVIVLGKYIIEIDRYRQIVMDYQAQEE